jgi:hypothetical protein
VTKIEQLPVRVFGTRSYLCNAETVAHVYKALWLVEDIIRTSNRLWTPGPSTTGLTGPFVEMWLMALRDVSKRYCHAQIKRSALGTDGKT